MKKSVQISWLLLMAILFFLPFPAFRIVKNKIDTTNYEKRTLAKKPALKLNTLEKYPSEFDAWMNDNLPFRNQLIGVRNLTLLKLDNRLPSKKVIVGKEGWFFYNPRGKDGNPIADSKGINLFSAEELNQIKEQALQTKKKLAEQGIEYLIFVAPNKEHIYADKLPDRYGKPAEYTRADQIYECLKDEVRIVYPKDELFQARRDFPQYDFYYRLDTHWNELGAYVGAKVLLKELGFEIPGIGSPELSIEESKRSSGDLVNMMGLRPWQDQLGKDSVYLLKGYSDNYVEVVKNDSAEIRYQTIGADARKVVLIRDSFATALAPYVASKFYETVLFSRGKYKAEMLKFEHPDVVIYETVERYLRNLKDFQIVE